MLEKLSASDRFTCDRDQYTEADKHRFYRLLVQETSLLIEAVCAKYFPIREDREDVAQDVLIRMWERLPRLMEVWRDRDVNGFKAYIITLASNVARNHLERGRRKRHPLVNLQAARQMRADSHPAREVEHRDVEHLTQRLLSQREYDVMALKLREYRDREIADHLQISVYTVKEYAKTARTKLRKYLSFLRP